MKEQLIEAGCLLQEETRKMGDDRKIHKIFLSARIVGSSENLVTSSSDAVEPLVGRPPDGW